MNVRFNIPRFSKRDGVFARRLFLTAKTVHIGPEIPSLNLVSWSYLQDLLTAHWVIIDGGLFMTSTGNGIEHEDVCRYPTLVENEGTINHVHLESIAARQPLQFYLAAKLIENWARFIAHETDVKRDVTFYVTQDRHFELCVYGPKSRSALADVDRRFSAHPLVTAGVEEFTSWVVKGTSIRGIPSLRDICEERIVGVTHWRGRQEPTPTH